MCTYVLCVCSQNTWFLFFMDRNMNKLLFVIKKYMLFIVNIKRKIWKHFFLFKHNVNLGLEPGYVREVMRTNMS